jgi:hypothetical protein
VRLHELQDFFQRAIIAGDDAVLSEIMPGARERRERLLEVYREGYVDRLVKVLGRDHELLQAYLGDTLFEAMAREYVAANPSRDANVRWYARHLPKFLNETVPYSSHPEVAELALLEKTLNDASDAQDATVLQLADLASVEPEAWGRLRFKPRPSAARLDLTTNVAAVWISLKEHKDPPAISHLRSPERILVWRQGDTPSFRMLNGEEAKAWDGASKGIAFGVLCESLAVINPDDAATRAASYLHSWISSGLLSSAIAE